MTNKLLLLLLLGSCAAHEERVEVYSVPEFVDVVCTYGKAWQSDAGSVSVLYCVDRHHNDYEFVVPSAPL